MAATTTTRPDTCSGCGQPATPELGERVQCKCRIAYDRNCGACWLGFGHNLDRHNLNIAAPSKYPPGTLSYEYETTGAFNR